MFRKILSPDPIAMKQGIFILRFVTGLFLLYHGWEIFSTHTMNEYLQWDIFKSSSGKFQVYAGKAAELLAGCLLTLGLFTRVGAIITICTMGYISLFVGHAKIWYEDQYPFLFVLLGFVFLFTGPGAASLDALLFKKRK